MDNQIFKFENYNFNPVNGVVVFDYSLGKIKFREKLIFPKGYKKINGARKKALDKALFNLFLMAGISYYKTYCPKKIDLGKYKLCQDQVRFWNKVYTKGLGQFFYENKIDFRGLINFPYDKDFKVKSFKLKTRHRSIVPLGGGKDSIVVLEKMKQYGMDFGLSYMGDSKIVRDVAKISGQKIFIAKRQISPNLFSLNKKKGVYNGHIPISAYYAFILLVWAILYDYKYIVMGNEKSANYGNIKYLGSEINHQWSKSIEFENAFRNYVKNFVTPNIEYFSLLRPWHEIKIAREFVKYKKYHHIFSSCNVNFKITKKAKKRWCGKCPKDIFVWTILSAYVAKKELIKIFGKNLYADKTLITLFWQLLGLKDFKPFECVGLPEEMKLAMAAASRKGDYDNDVVMQKFIVEVLPKIKNIKQLEKQLFSDSRENNIPVEFNKLLSKKILILGFAREGLSSYNYFKKENKNQLIAVADVKKLAEFDKKYRNILEKDKNLKLFLGKNHLKGLEQYDVIVKTAGKKLAASTVKKLEQANVEVTTNLNIFLENIRGKIIGVSGTKGKSTSASLIYKILKAAGKKVFLVGNIGKPFLDYLKYDSHNTLFVAELSSHQLDTLGANSALNNNLVPHKIDIGLITSFFPEHLTYHGSLKNYFEAKMNLARNAKIIFYNENYAALKSYIKKLPIRSFAYSKPQIKIVTKLMGRHNMENIAGVIKVAEWLKINNRIIKKAIKNFKPMEHRLEYVGKFKGIHFYNDVLSTTAESTVQAINALKDKKLETLIIGGLDRGLDYEPLIKKIINIAIKNVIYWPHTGEIVAKGLKKAGAKSKLIKAQNMEEAVSAAGKYSSPNSTVLLSPAASSYDFYHDYREKGNEFKRLVRKF